MTPSIEARSSVILSARVRHTWWAALVFGAVLLASRSIWLDHEWIIEPLEWIGYGCLIICVLGRTWCAVYIGGRKGSVLVAEGPYSVMRNPLYVFSFIGVVGIGLVSGMLTVAIGLLVLFGVYYRVVVRREEIVLSEAFAEAYDEYRARVPRWVPRFGLWHDQPELVVQPKRIFCTMRDSAWFFIALPSLEMIEYLQEADVMPILLNLP